jgi:hypothetical protein
MATFLNMSLWYRLDRGHAPDRPPRRQCPVCGMSARMRAAAVRHVAARAWQGVAVVLTLAGLFAACRGLFAQIEQDERRIQGLSLTFNRPGDAGLRAEISRRPSSV